VAHHAYCRVADSELPEILRPPHCQNDSERQALLGAGCWIRYLTSSGCYAWIHSYTRDITLLRPEEYDAAIDDAAVSMQVVLHTRMVNLQYRVVRTATVLISHAN
jgi:hypothetical protein